MTRRGANEGSISHRRDGRWEARISLGFANGRRVRKTFYGRTRREVQAALSESLQRQRFGLPILTDERLTVGAFLERWLDLSIASSVRASTHRRYAQIVRTHLVPALGRIQLRKLEVHHVQLLLNARLAAGLGPRTVHHLRAVLRGALNQAQREGHVARNVAALTHGPRVPHREVQPLDPEQTRRFLNAAAGDPLEALYVLAITTGLRQGELLGLQWEDIDLEAQTLRVRQAVQRVGGKLVFVEPKTRQSRRSVPYPPMAAIALKTHRTRQIEDRLFAGPRWREYHLVFASSIGTPLDGTNVTHRLRRLLQNHGLPRQRFHDLRHTAASLLLAQGVHPRVVMELLGHSQISLTMNTYMHVIPTLERDAADRIEALLSVETGTNTT
jgi:integrase